MGIDHVLLCGVLGRGVVAVVGVGDVCPDAVTVAGVGFAGFDVGRQCAELGALACYGNIGDKKTGQEWV